MAKSHLPRRVEGIRLPVLLLLLLLHWVANPIASDRCLYDLPPDPCFFNQESLGIPLQQEVFLVDPSTAQMEFP